MNTKQVSPQPTYTLESSGSLTFTCSFGLWSSSVCLMYWRLSSWLVRPQLLRAPTCGNQDQLMFEKHIFRERMYVRSKTFQTYNFICHEARPFGEHRRPWRLGSLVSVIMPGSKRKMRRKRKQHTFVSQRQYLSLGSLHLIEPKKLAYILELKPHRCFATNDNVQNTLQVCPP